MQNVEIKNVSVVKRGRPAKQVEVKEFDSSIVKLVRGLSLSLVMLCSNQ